MSFYYDKSRVISNMSSRRQILKVGLGSLAGFAAFGLAGCNAASLSSVQPQGPVALQLLFWGSAKRDTLTKQAMTLFHTSDPAVTITEQFTGFTTYWPMLDALVAKGHTPDLIQMDMRYLSQYVRKGLLLDLTQLIYNQTIDLSDYDPALLDSSKANNTVYGIPMGGNYQSMFYDTVLLEKANVKAPLGTITWDAFADYTTQITNALDNKVYGTSDNSGDITNFEVWIRQHGKDLYTHDGDLAFDLNDITDWYAYWSNLRKAGGCLPTKLQMGLDVTGTPDNATIIKGRAVFNITYSNLYDAYQGATPHPLGLTLPPIGEAGSTPGMYLKPSMLLSVAATTKYPDESASFISFINNDSNAVKALGIERGIPGSVRSRVALIPGLTPVQQIIATYINSVPSSGQARVKEVLDPPAAGQVSNLLLSVSQDIGLGRTSVADGAKAFYTQAKKLLSK